MARFVVRKNIRGGFIIVDSSTGKNAAFSPEPWHNGVRYTYGFLGEAWTDARILEAEAIAWEEAE